MLLTIVVLLKVQKCVESGFHLAMGWKLLSAEFWTFNCVTIVSNMPVQNLKDQLTVKKTTISQLNGELGKFKEKEESLIAAGAEQEAMIEEKMKAI